MAAGAAATIIRDWHRTQYWTFDWVDRLWSPVDGKPPSPCDVLKTVGVRQVGSADGGLSRASPYVRRDRPAEPMLYWFVNAANRASYGRQNRDVR